jgi:hypothetical protein
MCENEDEQCRFLCTPRGKYYRTQENKGAQVKRVGRADFLTIGNALVKHARFEVAVRAVTGRNETW